jgi:hypothetical protein
MPTSSRTRVRATAAIFAAVLPARPGQALAEVTS